MCFTNRCFLLLLTSNKSENSQKMRFSGTELLLKIKIKLIDRIRLWKLLTQG